MRLPLIIFENDEIDDSLPESIGRGHVTVVRGFREWQGRRSVDGFGPQLHSAVVELRSTDSRGRLSPHKHEFSPIKTGLPRKI
jgi:hypothetical protein